MVTPVKNHKTIKIQMNTAAKFRVWAKKKETGPVPPPPRPSIDVRKFSIAPTGTYLRLTTYLWQHFVY